MMELIEREQRAGLEVEQVTKKAGLDYDVLEAPVLYRTFRIGVEGINEQIEQAGRHKVLYHSGDFKPISVVGNRYKVIQPREIVGFFRDLIEIGGYSFTGAGVTHDRSRVWVQAQVDEGVEIVKNDRVMNYLLLFTSYDGSAATIAMPMMRRVVCNNQLPAIVTMARHSRDAIKVSHRSTFDADRIKAQLGVLREGYIALLEASRTLARVQVNATASEKFVADLLGIEDEQTARASAACKAVMGKFLGAGKGATMPGVAGTAWGLLNAVTEWVDHDRGSDAKRHDSALFGSGAAVKNRALRMLVDEYVT